MKKDIIKEYNIYKEKSKLNSIRESWVKKKLPLLYKHIKNNKGDKLSEKIFLLNNDKPICKVCNGDVSFLSFNRGYRKYCSKKCSNNDKDLINKKLDSYKKNNIEKWGVDNPSKLKNIKEKISKKRSSLDYEKINKKFKKTCIKNWGVDNPSKSKKIKKKKELTNLVNSGVKNPFKSNKVKDKIKSTLIEKYGVDSPIKNNDIKNKIKETNIKKWGVDNYTKSKEYKELMFNKWRSKDIKTNLNTSPNYDSYIGLGIHKLKCDNGSDHLYQTNSHLYHSRKKLKSKQCTVCFPVNKTSSFKEIELYDFIKFVYNGKILKSYRDGLEIDIYLPDLNLGFEFNGLYWHSELFKDKNYHLNKTNHFKEKEIKIIHIWEDDWDFKKDIIKSQIKNWLNLTESKIWARKCEVKEIKKVNEYKDFLDNNHIQGYSSASIKIGLYYNQELVSLMTFDKFEGRKKMSNFEWNLSRFCNKLNINVVGGASKLLNYFIKNYKPKRLISFADKSWSNGNLYKILGFKIVKISYPNYSYLINNKRSNKQKWKKSNLVKMGFDNSLSESKIMEDNFGSYKIFDCGQIKFELIF